MPRCLYCLSLYVSQAEGRQEQPCECGEMVCEQDMRDQFYATPESDAEGDAWEREIAESRLAQLVIDEAIAKCEE